MDDLLLEALASNSLLHLSELLRNESLADLSSQSRQSLLAHLMTIGITKVGDKQRVANAIARASKHTSEPISSDGVGKSVHGEAAGEPVSDETSALQQRLKELGNEQLAAGDTQAAIDSYRQALEVKDEDVTLTAMLQNNLSLALLRHGHAVQAEAAAAKGLQTCPTVKGHYRRGAALSALGDHETAATYYQAACELASDPAERRPLLLALEKCSAKAPARCPGCGYAVTWHPTHCCTRCSVCPGEHGPHCERLAPFGRMPRRRVEPLHARRIVVSEGGALRSHLLEHGFAVASDVVRTRCPETP